MNNLCKLILSLAGVIGLVFSVFLFQDNRYALSQTVKMLEQRLDQKIDSDQLYETQKRIWQLEDRHCDKNLNCTMSPSVKEEYRVLKEKKHLLEEKVKQQKQ